MPKVQIDKTQSLIDEYKNIKYFCPYPLCRSLFKDIYNDHKIQVVKKGYTYQCIHCGEHFNRSTYEEKRKCGIKHQIHKTMDKTKDEYLEFHIGNLWNEYYTDREIHTITHFSKDLVEKVTKEFRNNVLDICTIEEFDKKYLSDLDNKYPLIPWRDLRTHKIRKAFRLGCSVSQIRKILKRGTNTIVNAKSGRYLSEKRNMFYHSVLSSKNTIIVLTDEQLKFSEETDNFLKKAEPPITHKKSNNKNRTLINISPEDEKIRIYGISNRKK